MLVCSVAMPIPGKKRSGTMAYLNTESEAHLFRLCQRWGLNKSAAICRALAECAGEPPPQRDPRGRKGFRPKWVLNG